VHAGVTSRGWGVASADRERLTGGHGEVLGDEGSAAWIGREAARVSVKSAERRHRTTALKDSFLSYLETCSPKALEQPDWTAPRLDRYQLAAFAPQVFQAAREGDETAREILEQAGQELAVLAIALVSSLQLIDDGFELLPTGCVFGWRGPTLEVFMKQVRNKTMRASFLREGAGMLGGGVLLAIDHLGLKVDGEMARTVAETLAR